MKIAHIFNVVNRKHENDSYIDEQEFKIDYWKKSYRHYKALDYEELESDYAKMHYYGLVPEEDKSIISKYDINKFNSLTDTLGDKLLLISGDFWGIQKFIFDGITTSKASKILRSRSAIIQLITYCVVDRVKREFSLKEPLLFGAGKFLMLSKREEDYNQKIKNIQDELNSFFLKKYFGQNGFILAISETNKDKVLNKNQKDNMQEDLTRLAKDNDSKKFNKFDFSNIEFKELLIETFKNSINDDEICEFCSKRVKTHNIDDTKACDVCYAQIELGKQLTKNDYISIVTSDNLLDKSYIPLIKLDKYYYAKLSNDSNLLDGDIFDISSRDFSIYPKWSLNSYVPRYSKDDEEAKSYNDSYKDVKEGMIKTFNHYLDKKVNGKLKTVSSGLMVLKADIDKLGDTFRELFKEDFKKFNRLSREVDFFFTDYVTSLIEKKDNIYTVFAGGDDLFLIGEYKEILQLAKEIREEFLNFSLKKATISMGLVMFKPSTPIPFVSKLADEAESRAKVERDSIDIFGVSMKFDEFNQIEEEFNEVIKYIEDKSKDTTAFYYRLIELCDMKENLRRGLSSDEKYKDYEFNPKDALWKSKLNYLFRRTIDKEDNDSKIFDTLNRLVEKGEKFKPHIFLKIYQNRDQNKEK